jgi:hypothetical protein
MALHDPTHLFEGEISENTYAAAKLISFVTQPQLFSIVLFAILCTVCSSITEYAVVYGLCLFFGCIFPIFEVLYYSKKFKNDDGDVVRREDRFIPLLLGVISYVLGIVSLWFVGAPKIVTVLFVCYAVVTFAITVITPKWKISIHACGMIGPGMAITYAFFPWGLLIYITVPFICWSRYVLRKHTPAQMAGGIIVGFAITLAIFLLML